MNKYNFLGFFNNIHNSINGFLTVQLNIIINLITHSIKSGGAISRAQ